MLKQVMDTMGLESRRLPREASAQWQRGQPTCVEAGLSGCNCI